jgi:hypothetical protein
MPILLYGNSYSLLSAPYNFNEHYSVLASRAMGCGGVVSYGVSATRIFDVCGTMHNNSPLPALRPVVSGGRMNGNKGLVVIEDAFNTIGHYPADNVGVVVPAALNQTYRDTVKTHLRLAMAHACGGTRVEQTLATFTGTWSSTAVATAYASGGTLAYTTTAAAKVTYTNIKPPQFGPLAGKVFLVGFNLSSGVGTMAAVQTQVDALAAVNVTVPQHDLYTGYAGASANVGFVCIPVDVPVDGAAHSVALIHNGTTDQYMYNDCLLIPPVEPNPIAVMGAETPANPVLWTQAQCDQWAANAVTLNADIKAVVAEFPNAVWVPSTVSQADLYTGDGIHLSQPAMNNRAKDLIFALEQKFRGKYGR